MREAFGRNVTERDELGAAVTVLLDGAPVADLRGGWADEARTRPLGAGDPGPRLVHDEGPHGALRPHPGRPRAARPPGTRRPVLAGAGKESVLVRHLLSHRSGLAGLRQPHSLAELYDGELTCTRPAATEPWWEPGTRSGYHAITFGFLVGEVVRRITGLLPGEFLRQEITGPLGIDFTSGLPEKDTHRVAELVRAKPARAAQAALLAHLEPVAVAPPLNLATGRAVANTPEWRAAEIPAPTATERPARSRRCTESWPGTASLDGRRILSRQAAERVREGQGGCRDLVVGGGFAHDAEIALGVWLSGPNRSYGPHPRAVGHDGAGGSRGPADPESGIALGYVMNRMGTGIADDPRKWPWSRRRARRSDARETGSGPRRCDSPGIPGFHLWLSGV